MDIQLVHGLLHGIALPDAAYGLLRGAVGCFFTISGYHKLFNPSRHAALVETLTEDFAFLPRRMVRPFVAVNQWHVPMWEFGGGILFALGLGSVLVAFPLGFICFMACVVDGRKRVTGFGPIDRADRLDDWLYLPEVWYGLVLSAIILHGPGRYSLDHLIFG